MISRASTVKARLHEQVVQQLPAGVGFARPGVADRDDGAAHGLGRRGAMFGGQPGSSSRLPHNRKNRHSTPFRAWPNSPIVAADKYTE